MRYSYLQATTSDGVMVFPRVPTDHVFLVNVYEGEIDPPTESEGSEHRGSWIGQKIWETHQNEPYSPPDSRPLAKTIRSMVTGDVIVLHDGPSEDGLDDHSLVLIVAPVGFVRASEETAEVARTLAERGVPAHRPVAGQEYYESFETDEAEESSPVS